MEYKATWNDVTGYLEVTENGDVIHQAKTSTAPEAANELRHIMFALTDMWTRVPHTQGWTAPLKAVEKERLGGSGEALS